MEIKRRGASKDHGWASRKPTRSKLVRRPAFQWDTETRSLQLWLRNVNFGGNSSHDYVVMLSAKDIADLIGTLGDDAVADATKIEKSMRRALRGLTRLTAIASGLPVTSQSENNDS